MKNIKIVIAALFLSNISIVFAQVQHVPVGVISQPQDAEVELMLVQRFQNYNARPNVVADHFDTSINSPKSVNILDAKDKFYVQSLEGYTTSVYSLTDFRLLKTIMHVFDEKNQYLFKEKDYFDYKFRTRRDKLNYFSGKPVESCFSHDGKYLWVTYYRRSYDQNAIDPSALCIIDTDADTIVRVMPTAPLPKMIAASPDSKTIAVTHCGDNTVALIDINSDKPADFKYIKNVAIDRRLTNDFDANKTINRDNNCGNCLRGTIFTPDNHLVLIGKMGSNAVAVVDVETQKYIASITGMKNNLRHLILTDSCIYLSINQSGFVQKANLQDFLRHISESSKTPYDKWTSVYVGEGARTIVADPSGRYIFAAISNKSRVVVVRTVDMKVIANCTADSYPVGMDISTDGKTLIVTAQGKADGGGNSVMVFNVLYKIKEKNKEKANNLLQNKSFDYFKLKNKTSYPLFNLVKK
jgi:YVTN family beta-propeller protein